MLARNPGIDEQGPQVRYANNTNSDSRYKDFENPFFVDVDLNKSSLDGSHLKYTSCSYFISFYYIFICLFVCLFKMACILK